MHEDAPSLKRLFLASRRISPSSRKHFRLVKYPLANFPSPLSHLSPHFVKGERCDFSLLIQWVFQPKSRKEKVASKDVASSQILQDLEVPSSVDSKKVGPIKARFFRTQLDFSVNLMDLRIEC